MKRFFDLSLLLLVPMLLIGIYTSDSTPTMDTPEVSEQAMEIHALVSPHVEMSLEDIQKSLDSAGVLNAPCELGCNPPNCCFTRKYLNKMIAIFGCCIGEEGNECGTAGCLDLDENGCVGASDLSILLSNYCGD